MIAPTNPKAPSVERLTAALTHNAANAAGRENGQD